MFEVVLFGGLKASLVARKSFMKPKNKLQFLYIKTIFVFFLYRKIFFYLCSEKTRIHQKAWIRMRNTAQIQGKAT